MPCLWLPLLSVSCADLSLQDALAAALILLLLHVVCQKRMSFFGIPSWVQHSLTCCRAEHACLTFMFAMEMTAGMDSGALAQLQALHTLQGMGGIQVCPSPAAQCSCEPDLGLFRPEKFLLASHDTDSYMKWPCCDASCTCESTFRCAFVRQHVMQMVAGPGCT